MCVYVCQKASTRKHCFYQKERERRRERKKMFKGKMDRLVESVGVKTVCSERYGKSEN